jgi:hypothetical protein
VGLLQEPENSHNLILPEGNAKIFVMARLINGAITGSIANISYYQITGFPGQTFVRTKGGPSKSQVKNSKKFENTRKNNVEFGGRAKMAGSIMRGLGYHRTALADFNIAGQVTSLLRATQEMDKENPMGERDLLLSKCPKVLEGFQLNKKFTFDSIVRAPIAVDLEREGHRATVRVPQLIPSINFFPQQSYSLFRISFHLLLIPDLFCSNKSYDDERAHNGCSFMNRATEWFPVSKGSAPQYMVINLPHPPRDENFTLILSIGIDYGSADIDGTFRMLNKCGAAKIIQAV